MVNERSGARLLTVGKNVCAKVRTCRSPLPGSTGKL